MRTKVYSVVILLILVSGCNLFKSEREKELEAYNQQLTALNKRWGNVEIDMPNKQLDSVLQNKKDDTYSMLVYYDANCSSCFMELEKWKELIDYFEKLDKDLQLKFILYTDDPVVTNFNLENITFDREKVVYDIGNSYLDTYNHVLTKAFNTMLLDADNRIVFIGSPLLSKNLRKHYTNLLTHKNR